MMLEPGWCRPDNSMSSAPGRADACPVAVLEGWAMEVIVTLADGADAPQVVLRLVEAGFHLRQDLAAIGMLVGETEAANMDRLRAIPGVTAVEQSVSVSLPPEGPV